MTNKSASESQGPLAAVANAQQNLECGEGQIPAREVLYKPGWTGGHRGGLSLACLADFRSATNSSGVFICSQVISPGPAALSRELRSYEGRQGGKEQGDEVKSSPEFICTQVMLRLNNKPY